MFEEFIRAWSLEADGPPISTPRSELLPVLTRDGKPAMLKVGKRKGEVLAAALLEWWGGSGAVPVIARSGPAVLTTRAKDPQRLLRMYEDRLDGESTRIIAEVAAKLHAPRAAPPPDEIPPLETWFAGLPAAAERLGGVLHRCAHAATELLTTQTEMTVLHGDLHHENVLRFGDCGWLAIDPKGVLGERAFEFVPGLLDPDDGGDLDTVRLERLLALTAAAGRVDAMRLRRWLLAWAGLTATWWLEEGRSPEPSLRVAAALAAAEPA